jgi:diguanylate cyclase (GGDEF)-like protein
MTDMSTVPVLIVDDNATKRFALHAALEPLGYSIIEADSGIAALRCVAQEAFAVILLDVRMPDMDGFETAALMRTSPTTAMTPIIFITSHSSDEIHSDLYVSGAVDFIFAPVPSDELRAKVTAFAALFVQAAGLADERVELETLNDELMTIARRDQLTGLGNRRALEEDLQVMEARVIRYGQGYCIGIFDVDHFKVYNDAFGHQAGDLILITIAAALKDATRSGDVVYRYGGEEFLCIFPEQTLASGSQAAERMRAGLEQLAIPNAAQPPGVVTLSAGVAVVDGHSVRSAATVLKEADDALYRAKRNGRNRVEFGSLELESLHSSSAKDGASSSRR